VPANAGRPARHGRRSTEIPAVETGASTNSVLIAQRAEIPAAPSFPAHLTMQHRPISGSIARAEQPAGLSYGATIDAFAGYRPQGQYGWGGFMRFRTTPPAL
jgi:hypothetical protein